MSNIYKDDSPNQKSRFDKFKSSLLDKKITVEDNTVDPLFSKQLKRTRSEESLDSFPIKKVCRNLNITAPPITKNLANSRLQKLREKLQAELKTSNISKSSQKSSPNLSDFKSPDQPSPTKSIIKLKHQIKNQPNNNYNVSERERQDFVTNRAKNIYENLEKWASPPDPLVRKNLANQRLKKLKENVLISSLNSSPIANKCDSTNDDLKPKKNDHRSPLLAGIKRNISEVTFECSTPKKFAPCIQNDEEIYSNSISTNTVKIRNGNTQLQINDQNNSSVSNAPLKISESTDLSKTITPNSKRSNWRNKHISERLTKFKMSSSQNVSPTSNRDLKDDKAINKNYSFSNSKSTSDLKHNLSSIDGEINKTSSSINEPSYHSSSPLIMPNRTSENYSRKMEMTASWIRSNQQSENSLIHLDNIQNLSTDVNENLSKESATDSIEMEWTNAESDEEIIKPLEKDEEKIVKKGPDKLGDICIVVDTNVFINALSKIRDIMNIKVTGPIQPVLYVPWMVITELDYMKDSCREERLKKNLVNSIKFINTYLKDDNGRLIGQTIFEVEKQKQIGPSPDDKIISSCLQVAEKYETVILLSNDINLKNKALINGIIACSANEILMKIMSKLSNNFKSQKILQKMSILCSSVICECAKETYGNVWTKMDLLSCPPWSLAECLKRFKKYWNSVFKDKVMKHFTKTVNDLLELLKVNKYISDDSEIYNDFVKLCLAICIFLKDIEDCRGSVEITVADITKIG